jgi:hypothetical protein
MALTKLKGAQLSDLTNLTVDEGNLVFTDETSLDVTTARHGLAPKITDTAGFLRGDGTWAAPTGTSSLAFHIYQSSMMARFQTSFINHAIHTGGSS